MARTRPSRQEYPIDKAPTNITRPARRNRTRQRRRQQLNPENRRNIETRKYPEDRMVAQGARRRQQFNPENRRNIETRKYPEDRMVAQGARRRQQFNPENRRNIETRKYPEDRRVAQGARRRQQYNHNNRRNNEMRNNPEDRRVAQGARRRQQFNPENRRNNEMRKNPEDMRAAQGARRRQQYNPENRRNNEMRKYPEDMTVAQEVVVESEAPKPGLKSHEKEKVNKTEDDEKEKTRTEKMMELITLCNSRKGREKTGIVNSRHQQNSPEGITLYYHCELIAPTDQAIVQYKLSKSTQPIVRISPNDEKFTVTYSSDGTCVRRYNDVILRPRNYVIPSKSLLKPREAPVLNRKLKKKIDKILNRYRKIAPKGPLEDTPEEVTPEEVTPEEVTPIGPMFVIVPENLTKTKK